jgi:hypothetical protein
MVKTELRKKIARVLDSDFAKAIPGANNKLTDEQAKAIMDSFISLEEVMFFNRYNKFNTTMISHVSYLKDLFQAYTSDISRVNDLMMLLDASLKEAALLNAILEEIEDKKQKERIIKKIIESNRRLSRFIQKEDGSISVDITSTGQKLKEGERDTTLSYAAPGWALRATNNMRKAKAVIMALRQALKDVKLNMKTVTELLDKYEADFSKDRIWFDEFADLSLTWFDETTGENIDVKIYPKYSEVEPNEQEFKLSLKELKDGF